MWWTLRCSSLTIWCPTTTSRCLEISTKPQGQPKIPRRGYCALKATSLHRQLLSSHCTKNSISKIFDKILPYLFQMKPKSWRHSFILKFFSQLEISWLITKVKWTILLNCHFWPTYYCFTLRNSLDGKSAHFQILNYQKNFSRFWIMPSKNRTRLQRKQRARQLTESNELQSQPHSMVICRGKSGKNLNQGGIHILNKHFQNKIFW